jgi:hypothetical protein
MNKQERENIGLNWAVIAVGGFMITFLIGMAFVKGNAINAAPWLNKALCGILLAGQAYWLYLNIKGKVWLSSNHILNTIFKIVITIGIAALAFTILTVWHSGAIGTSTNPVKP